ncbi:class I SAM-dependent methyltransferase [Paenibacillus macerans]|uniref:class I SAM-dependent methyltransferase n=1 Tax=Paenibacillus macerans TaxID=44252 RepID=UPI00278BE508|nr:class I SAM-dependent methyltransferase [Paenibacillus macerans]
MIDVEDYWEKRYRDEGMIWGSEPSPTAYHALYIFRKQNVKTLLVPGSGYGRNTKAFSSIFQVDGIELSNDAIQIASNWDQNTNFIQGSILSDLEVSKKYDAIYCFDLLHLFLQQDRNKLVQNCLKQLNHPGLMYFTCFSDEDRNNRRGRQLEEGTYEYKANKYAHFFSDEDLRRHFVEFDIIETGSTIETLYYKDNQIKEYALRYIIVKTS